MANLESARTLDKKAFVDSVLFLIGEKNGLPDGVSAESALEFVGKFVADIEFTIAENDDLRIGTEWLYRAEDIKNKLAARFLV